MRFDLFRSGMNTKTTLPKRKSPRLPGYDYTLGGGYFITIVTHKHRPLFGEVVNGEVVLNEVGEMIKKEWLNLSASFPNVHLDQFIVMPNHLHGILFITEPDVGEGLVPSRKKSHKEIDSIKRAPTRDAPTLGEIIGAFKSKTTVKYIQGVKAFGWLPFKKRLWQRSLYGRIIRDEEELHNLREYIYHNVAKWPEDKENPKHL